MSSPARGERDAGGERAHLAAGCALGAACVALLGVRRRYLAELRAHWKRVGTGSQVIASPFGQIEYATAGTGPPVLVLHGAGGGFDQAISGASRLIGGGFHVIAPESDLAPPFRHDAGRLAVPRGTKDSRMWIPLMGTLRYAGQLVRLR